MKLTKSNNILLLVTVAINRYPLATPQPLAARFSFNERAEVIALRLVLAIRPITLPQQSKARILEGSGAVTLVLLLLTCTKARFVLLVKERCREPPIEAVAYS